MKMRTAILTLAFAGAASLANASPQERSGKILSVNPSGIQNWTAQNDSTLVVQAMSGDWYRVELAIPCTGLPFEKRIRFATTAAPDGLSSIAFDGERCPVQSVTPMASPDADQPSATK